MIRLAKLAFIVFMVTALLLSLLSAMGYKVPGTGDFFEEIYRRVKAWFGNKPGTPVNELSHLKVCYSATMLIPEGSPKGKDT